MRVRWIGLTLALVLVGVAAGYGLGAVLRAEPTTFASASPVPASEPSIPVLPTAPFAEDIPYPALQPGLTYEPHLIGGPVFQWAYDVPEGWTMERIDFAEVRWRPADEPLVGGFSVRVKIINAHQAPAEMVAQKRAAVLATYDDVEVTAEADDLLSFSYRDPGTDRQRFNTFQWFTEPGSTEASFEMSVVGRATDVPGLEDLLRHVAGSVHRVT